MASPAPPSGSKFKLFSRSRGRSPAPNKRETPSVLALGPPSPQDRWEAESDGGLQELETLGSVSRPSTPMPRVHTAPATLIHPPPIPLPQQPHTASHSAHFLTPSPNIPRTAELQHPFSADYERRSQASDRDHAVGSLRRARDTNNRRRPAPNPRDVKDVLIRSQTRSRSPDPRQRAFISAPVTSNDRGSPHAVRVSDDTAAQEMEVDLDVYPWFIFQHGESKGLVDTTEGQGYSFISW